MVILWAVIDATYMVGGFCNEHHKGKLLQVTNLLGASYGKKNIEARTICNDIVERFKPSKSDKEAAKKKQAYLLETEGVSFIHSTLYSYKRGISNLSKVPQNIKKVK